MRNPYKESARLRKAVRLAEAIRRCGGDAADAQRMTDSDWLDHAAVIAGVPAPSPTTRRLVVQILAGEMVHV